jgi:hypothetical protein
LQSYLTKSGGRWPSQTSRLIGSILDSELPTVNGLTSRDDGEWELRLDSRLRKFRGVQSITDYLDRVVAMLEPIEGAVEFGESIEILDDNPIWRPGRVRVFVTHLAMHRAFTAEVASALASWGVHGFVAHDTIEVSAERRRRRRRRRLDETC